MSHAVELLLATIFVNNVALVQFLGLCPLLGTSGKLANAFGMTLATACVLLLAAAACFALEHLVLAPLGLGWLRTLVFILVIAALVQTAELYLRAAQPLLHRALGVYIPLITTNCAVLGVVLINARLPDLLDTLVVALGAAGGFGLVLAAFAALRERIADNSLPAPFRGAAIAMISAGLLSLGFLGFAGIFAGNSG